MHHGLSDGEDMWNLVIDKLIASLTELKRQQPDWLRLQDIIKDCLSISKHLGVMTDTEKWLHDDT